MRVLPAVITQAGWMLSFMTAELLSLQLSQGLLGALVVCFVAGAVWSLIVNRRSNFWFPAVQATLAGIVTGALVLFSPCADCVAPQDVGAVILGTSASFVTLAGLGLGWLVHNGRGFMDGRVTPPRG